MVLCETKNSYSVASHEYIFEALSGSVVERCVSSAKVVGSIPREHT